MIVALDDAFVVAVPRTMKVTGFFRPGDARMIAADTRDEVFRKLERVAERLERDCGRRCGAARACR